MEDAPCSQLGDGLVEDEDASQQADDWHAGAESQPAGDADSSCAHNQGVPGTVRWCRSAAARLELYRSHQTAARSGLVPPTRLAGV
eukprot:1991249-Prymnesium_polylepis.1